MDATSLATVWATVGLLIFIGIVVYLKVPGMIAKALDARAAKIRADLDEARRLREEAQALLAEFQQKRKDAEQEAADIVTAAKREAELLLADAHKKTEDYVQRRTVMAEQKIAQAEREAVNEVRSSAVDIAVEAARKLLAGSADIKAGEELFKSSLQELKSKLN
ncbi:F0F1 ATP synthase subunit B [Mesorhizobium sp. YM1C-6-2]|uniref:F0F1 ATP synthase subunit B n=1 Tax=Mesorhizobium sp. YM1C-6-2 TaxID=1827501 RepID=UPI000EF18855|nr:F0F1 ATP synthase subunit B [Mesorhizobium sp. YM1C-6-2]RLP23250.1 F0F1 ATP synthase subunit B [Mesorhizobium sp. YM1C-6-2]